MQSKKLIAFFLSVLMTFGTLFSFSFTANAMPSNIAVRMIDTGLDEGATPNMWNGGHHNGGTNYLIIYMASGDMIYCIEPGVKLHSGDTLDVNDYVDHLTTPSISQPYIIPIILGRLFQYVNYGSTGSPTDTLEGQELYIAVQTLVWEISQGERDANFNYVTPPSGYDRALDSVRNSTMPDSVKTVIINNYNNLVAQVKAHLVIPSFAGSSALSAPTYQLTSNGGMLSVSLDDSNNVLGNFNFTPNDPGNVSCSVSGNKLTVTAKNGFSGDMTVKLSSKDTQRAGIICYGDGVGGYQDNIAVGTPIDDPVMAYFNVNIAVGNLSIIKTTQYNGGMVNGFTFEVRDSSGALVGTYTTTGTGKIDIPNLQAGNYSVKEINLSEDFVAPNPKTVTVQAGQTASVSFDNIRKRGVITIQKTNADPEMGDFSLAGAVFEIRDQGGALADTVTVQANGIGQSAVLPLGVYRITEKSSPPTGGFVRNTSTFSVALTGLQGTSDVVYAPNCIIPETVQVARIDILKTNSNPAMGDYSLAGAVFEIRDSAGNVVDTVTVDTDGKGESKDLKLGKGYTVTEKSSPYGFTRNKNTFTVDLDYGGEDKTVIYKTVSIPETPQTGQIKIHKYNTDSDMGNYDLKSAVFEIRNTVTGDLMDTVTVDSTGYGISKQLPLTQSGKVEYSCREVKAPWGFALNSGTFYPALSYGGQETEAVFADVTVPECPQTGIITVEKRDVYNGTIPSGDATLKGMVVEIYDSTKTKVVDTLYCGNDVKKSSVELKFGDYFYKEKIPPMGYTPDPDFHAFSIEYAGQETSIVYIGKTLVNKPIEGQISLVKHTDIPNPQVNDPQIEKPVAATFEIYLKSAGSYADAKPAERDRITTDSETGYAVTKKLPYGLYVVSETTAEGDVKKVAPFEVFISQEGKIYPFILNDYTFQSLVKVVKVDAETSAPIPAAGITVKIWDVTNNKWVEQTLNYPTIQTLSEFETAPDGTVVLPSPLPSGDYLLYEESGCYGYTLTKDPVPFTVKSNQQDPTVATVLLANTPVKGTITINKTGELLTGIQTIDTEFGTQYVPIFSQASTSGQKFVIKAARDIVTGDGTVRAKAGDIVDTLTIQNGSATSKLLYLGDYICEEQQVGEPFVSNPQKYPVSLVFEDENTPVVTSAVKVENKRETVELSLMKLMEKPAEAPADFNPFVDVTFGIYAAEAITDNAGKTVIPKDGLIALMSPDSTGKATLSAMLPFVKVYAMELKTNNFYNVNATKYPLDIQYQGENVPIAKFSLTGNGIAIPNELKTGKIVVQKTGEVLTGANVVVGKPNSIYTPVYKEQGLPGVIFKLFADESIYDVYGKLIYNKGDLVDTLVTGPNGVAESRNIHLGRYLLVEDVPDGYIGDGKYPVTLGLDGDVGSIITKTVDIRNERQKANLTLEKTMEMPNGADESYNPYTQVQFGLFAQEDIKSVEGTVVIPAGAMLEEFGVGQDGKAEIKVDLPVNNSFFVQELYTAPGYTRDNSKYNLVFNYDKNAGAVVNLAINDGDPIENKLQRGSLKIIKIFEGREVSIPGVPFEIIGTTAVGTTVTINSETDANGEILLDNLLAGNYRIVELESDLTAGYVLSPEENAIVAADKIAELTVNNKLQRSDLKIIKVFENQVTPVKGVQFTVTGTGAAGIHFEQTFETDENGMIQITGLPVGDYKIKELGSDLTAGYVLSDEQTATVAAAQLTEMRIDNRLIRGSVKLYKVDECGNKLPGAVYDLFAPDGTKIGSYTTCQNGVFTVPNLPYGKGYRLVETKAPAGYQLDSGANVFDITENGVTVEVTAVDKPVPVQKTPGNCDAPKTGDTTNINLWLVLMGVSAATLAGLIFADRHGKNKNKKTGGAL